MLIGFPAPAADYLLDCFRIAVEDLFVADSTYCDFDTSSLGSFRFVFGLDIRSVVYGAVNFNTKSNFGDEEIENVGG
jgi:hypothetical protein